MKRVLMAVLVILANSAFANSGDKILLKSRRFVPEQGVSSAAKAKIELIPGRAHVLIQFRSHPTIKDKKELESNGIKLLSYVPNQTWFASVPSDKLDEITSFPNVRAICEILPEDKIDREIREKGVNSYSTREKEEAKLTVIFFEDVSLKEASVIIIHHRGKIIAEVPNINALVVILPKNSIYELANNDSVHWIDQHYEPAITNDGARTAIGVNIVQDSPYNLTGTGVIVGEWDGGCVDATHGDLTGRVIQRNCWGDFPGHATHVAGTMLGNGIRSAEFGGTPLQWRGMAVNATVISYLWWDDVDDLYSDYNEAINTYSIDLSTNSWGNLDWDCEYDIFTQAEDNVVTGAYGKKIPIMWAAGNEGDDYGWRSFRSNAVAKNIVTVGATNSNNDSLAYFSSLGPTADGRVKPDVVAPGDQTSIDYGTTSTYPGNTYVSLFGTSMATPAVAGSVALMIEHWRNTHTGQPDPLPSTVKAILIQTAVDLGNTGPDFSYGWGKINVKDAVDFISEDSNNIILEDTIVDQGDKKQFSFIVLPNQPKLKITLVWDDYPGDPAAEKALVNDLDLIVRNPNGTRYYPWVLDVNSGHEDYPAVHGEDRLNNIEQVSVDNPVSGTWTVEINGTVVPQPVQRYSLVGNMPKPFGLDLIKADDVSEGSCVFPFSLITYTISYDANGVYDSNVKIVDYYPAEVKYISSSPEGYFNPFEGTVTWNIGPIAPDNNGVVTLNVQVKDSAESGGVITNRCEIVGDLTYSAAEVNTPVCTWNPGSVYLDIVDDINDENCISPETTITYTVIYDANGAVDKNVRLIDYLPIGLDYNSSSPDGFYNPADRTVTWNIGNLPPNGYGTFTLNTQINSYADPCSVLTNFCEIRGDSIYKSDEEDTLTCNWAVPGVIYVDCNRVNGADNGTSWPDAYLDLQDALDRAAIDSNITQIWVADGNYIPSVPDPCWPYAMTFRLIDDVELYGHFTGNEMSLSQRDLDDPNAETILSGEGVNSVYVVNVFDLNQNNLLGGFTITKGIGLGIGINVESSNIIIDDCIIQNNRTGIEAYDSSLKITNCIIQNNFRGISANFGNNRLLSDTQITDSIIRNNTYYGIYLSEVNSIVVLVNNLIHNNGYPGNSRGGVLFSNLQQSLAPVIQGCKIFSNADSGIVLNYKSSAIIFGNWIYLNDGNGVLVSSMFGYEPNAIIRNNTIVGNDYGIRCILGPIYEITSNIVWGNGQDLTDCNATYSWLTSNGDPCFVDADNNDFHLKLGSPCIDAGDPNFNDFNALDIDGQCRILFGTSALRVDFGADEFYWPKADYNRDKFVDFFDYSIFSPAWNEPNEVISLDTDPNVNIYDLAIFCDDWLWEVP